MRVLLDTNVWRSVVDRDQVEQLRKTARRAGHRVVVAPAVVYEMLRTSDSTLRNRLLRAATLSSWERLMPEIYDESMAVLETVRARRTDWLRPEPDRRSFHRLQADWTGSQGFWKRARERSGHEAEVLASAEGTMLQRARADAQQRRSDMSRLHFDTLRLEGWRARPSRHLPGWEGDEVDVWRLQSAGLWWRQLVLQRDGPYVDWLGPWLDLAAIRRSEASWNHLWVHEVTVDELPREWLRWAVEFLQGVRKVTPGTPGDNQIATYLFDVDLLLTSDAAFAAIVNKVRAEAPQPVALALVLTPRDDVTRELAGVTPTGARPT